MLDNRYQVKVPVTCLSMDWLSAYETLVLSDAEGTRKLTSLCIASLAPDAPCRIDSQGMSERF